MSLAELKPEGRGVFVQKQRANVYTMLLVIALMEIVVGCLCLYLQMNIYQFKVKVATGGNSCLPTPQVVALKRPPPAVDPPRQFAV